jgi:hypothetical protein
VIAELLIAHPNSFLALSYVNMVFAKELDTKFQGFLPIFKCLLVITELTIAYPNVVIALRNSCMYFAVML